MDSWFVIWCHNISAIKRINVNRHYDTEERLSGDYHGNRNTIDADTLPPGNRQYQCRSMAVTMSVVAIVISKHSTDVLLPMTVVYC